MPKPSPEYRTDNLACPVNAGKLSRVRDLVLVMRQVAGREAKLQWQMFYQGGWQGFEHSAGKGWNRPWEESGLTLQGEGCGLVKD